MTHHVLLAVSLLTVLCSPSVLLAQDAEQAAREAAFSELMSGCKMVGVFTTEGSKTLPQPETYELGEVMKVEGAKWRIKAKIQYAGKRAVSVPITVNVHWAGDTPMIQVTDLKIPLMGTFTARVFVFRGQYVGTWSAKDHGGYMYGNVIPAPVAPEPVSTVVAPEDPKPGVGAWTQYRGDALNTGVSYSKVPDWTKLGIKWRYWTGSYQSSTPAVADGKIVVCTEDGDMHCVNAADGKGLWKVMCTTQRGAGHGIVFCSPLIHDGMVYIGNRIGQLWAVDFETGKVKWHWQEDGLKPEIYSSPKVGELGIIFGTVDQKAHRGHVVCLDAKTGKLKWRCRTSREVGATVALFGGNVYAPCKDRRIYEIEQATGKLLRQFQLPGTTHCTPTIAMGFAFLMAGGDKSLAVDLITGEIAWEVETLCEDKVAVSFWNGRVFYPVGRFLRAFDAVDGREAWAFEAEHKLTPPCVAADGAVLLTGRDRFFRVIDKNGKQIKKINLGEPFVAGPILVDGVVYLTSDVNIGHHLFAIAELE